MAKSFHRFDGMCWPLPGERCAEVEWKLRHAPESMTREDELVAASILSAYVRMVFDPHHKRVRVIRELRSAVGKDDGLWNPFGNDGMRHMENADVIGGATDETSDGQPWKCTICNNQNPDDATHCRQCEYSRTVMRDGQRVPRDGRL